MNIYCKLGTQTTTCQTLAKAERLVSSSKLYGEITVKQTKLLERLK